MDPDNFSLLKAVFCHTVLPPKLPGAFDGDSVELVQDFGARLKHALSTFKNVGDENVWARLHDSLETTKAVNRGYLDKNDLLDAFKHLATHQDNTWLGVHVTQQNAAIVIHRDTGYTLLTFPRTCQRVKVNQSLAVKVSYSSPFRQPRLFAMFLKPATRLHGIFLAAQ